MTGCTRSEHASPMLDRPHPGKLVRESMGEVRWNVPETGARPGGARDTLLRRLNGRTGLSVKMALALEALG